MGRVIFIDIIGENGLPFIKRGGKSDASLLCEVPFQKGNERRQGHNHEEWQAGDPGRMPYLWDQDVQDREELKLKLLPIAEI